MKIKIWFLLFFVISILFAENNMELIWEQQGEHQDSEYGSDMAALDYNGDGIDDLVIGSLMYEWGYGKLYFYYGGDEFDTEPDLTITGILWNWLGRELHNYGDINGDGFDDLGVIILNPESEIEKTIEIYYGGTACDTIPDFQYDIPWELDVSVSPIYPLGDINGDGFSDAGYVRKGSLIDIPYTHFYILYGNDTEPYVEYWNSTGNWYISGEQGSAYIRGIGNINNDQFDDFIIGYFDNETLTRHNAVVYGNTVVDTVITNPIYSVTTPYSTGGAGIGDFNGDGIDDFIGCWIYQTSCPAIWFGGNEQNEIPDIHLSDFGSYDKGLDYGDFNNDGFDDLVIGDPEWSSEQGKIRFFLGKENPNGGNDLEIEAPMIVNSYFGDSIAVGDFNNDGYDDVAVGAPSLPSSFRGYAYVYAGNISLIDTVTVSIENNIIPVSEVNLTAYPNPFNPIVNFEIKSDDGFSKPLSIEIFNLKGQKVDTLNLSSKSNQRSKQITWNAENYASGIYFAKLVTIEKSEILAIQKITLMK